MSGRVIKHKKKSSFFKIHQKGDEKDKMIAFSLEDEDDDQD